MGKYWFYYNLLLNWLIFVFYFVHLIILDLLENNGCLVEENVSLSYIKISNQVASQVQTNDSRPGSGNQIWNTKQIMYLINVKYCNEHESDLFTYVLSSYSGGGRRRARTCYRRRTRTGTYTHSCRYHPLLFLLFFEHICVSALQVWACATHGQVLKSSTIRNYMQRSLCVHRPAYQPRLH